MAKFSAALLILTLNTSKVFYIFIKSVVKCVKTWTSFNETVVKCARTWTSFNESVVKCVKTWTSFNESVVNCPVCFNTPYMRAFTKLCQKE